MRDGNDRLDTRAFTPVERLSLAELPTPARVAGRAGAAFSIAHQGKTMCNFVMGWWDNENELPLRVWVTERNGSVAWRKARGSEGLCVWDLDIMWFERRMYVNHVMVKPHAFDIGAYLRAFHARAVPLRELLDRI